MMLFREFLDHHRLSRGLYNTGFRLALEGCYLYLVFGRFASKEGLGEGFECDIALTLQRYFDD